MPPGWSPLTARQSAPYLTADKAERAVGRERRMATVPVIHRPAAKVFLGLEKFCCGGQH